MQADANGPGTVLNRVHEPVAIKSWRVLAIGLGTLAFLLLAMTGLYFLARPKLERSQIPLPAAVPEPQLQSDPAGDLRSLQALQKQQLEGYAWIDREHGLIRIPVARAMEILAGRGKAAFAPLEAPNPAFPLPVRPEAARADGTDAKPP
jgi:hypothetical protein